MTFYGGLAVAFCAFAASVTALSCLRMWLTFKAQAFEHAPIAKLEKRLDEMENRLLAGAMRGGR